MNEKLTPTEYLIISDLQMKAFALQNVLITLIKENNDNLRKNLIVLKSIDKNELITNQLIIQLKFGNELRDYNIMVHEKNIINKKSIYILDKIIEDLKQKIKYFKSELEKINSINSTEKLEKYVNQLCDIANYENSNKYDKKIYVLMDYLKDLSNYELKILNLIEEYEKNSKKSLLRKTVNDISNLLFLNKEDDSFITNISLYFAYCKADDNITALKINLLKIYITEKVEVRRYV